MSGYITYSIENDGDSKNDPLMVYRAFWLNVIYSGIHEKDLEYLESETCKEHCEMANISYAYLQRTAITKLKDKLCKK